jgi:hypothetical protein
VIEAGVLGMLLELIFGKDQDWGDIDDGVFGDGLRREDSSTWVVAMSDIMNSPIQMLY